VLCAARALVFGFARRGASVVRRPQALEVLFHGARDLGQGPPRLEEHDLGAFAAHRQKK
jgi:hypothetical protein